ncbi:MAG TPA: glycosyltransferase [Chitinophagaceae bacterium]
MNLPSVSVILPAYNCEKFIGKAIQSVLQQTLSDFELIIVNDGSTDNTESIIHEFNDPRIVYQKNRENKGLINSLNTAISMAKGKYTARMDADDICLLERLSKQKAFLDQNENITAVASTIEFINDREEKIGIWELDRQTITPGQIKKALLRQNCIAHPTVVIRSEMIKLLKYKEYQKNIEDYDLWLRLLNRGLKIAKLEEPLLLYRVHDTSITSLHLKTSNPFFKHLVMKMKFLIHFRHISWFAVSVFGSAIMDLIRGFFKAIKNIFGK